MGYIFERLKRSLSKTRRNLSVKLESLLKVRGKIDSEVLEELESILIQADLGMKTTAKVLERMREERLKEPAEIKPFLKKELVSLLLDCPRSINLSASLPSVVLVVGVNGVGKTTSLAKLAYRFREEKKKVLLAASDTFRAGSIEQLGIWGKRIGAEVIKHQYGADPAAVAYDALSAAQARGVDILFVDTAGRLHTKRNLVEELRKIKRVLGEKKEGAPEETLLVLDATIGQNALSQAKLFKEALKVTGIILTKLDGTAKGGMVIAIENELNIPVKLVGMGESLDDLAEFDREGFVEALFSS